MSTVSWLSGAYTDLDGPTLEGMGTWRGRAMDICSFFPTRDNSTTLRNTYYLDDAYSGGAPALSIGMPMCYTGGSLSQDLSADCTAIANDFAADGRMFYIRLGWEMNLPSWPWAVTNANVSTWKSRFSTYANIFNSILGSKVSIGLNPNIGANQSGYTGTMTNLLSASTHIKWAGPDCYDWFPPFNSDPNVNTQFNTTQGLDFWSDFARDNGLGLAVPEWGVVSGSSATGNEGGDNARYITEMVVNFMAANSDVMLFDTYFNETQDYLLSDIYRQPGDGSVSNPLAAARYLSMFGGSSLTASASNPIVISQSARLAGGKTPSDASNALTLHQTASVTGGHLTNFPQAILGVRAELFIDGAWTDISSRVRTGDGGVVSITRGRPDESNQPPPSSMSLLLNNRDGRFSPRNPTSPYYGKIGRNTPIRVGIAGESFAQITQATGANIGTLNVSASDSVATSITSDIDIRVEADLVSWRDFISLYGKWTATGNQKSYDFALQSNGTLKLFWSNDGSTVPGGSSTVPVPVTSGRLAVRVTLDVNNGASGNTLTFYTSDSIAGTWTQLGATVTQSGTTSIFNSTSPSYFIDVPDDGINSVTHGRFYAAEVRNGIGGILVANPDFTALSAGTTSFSDTCSNTWTLNSSAGSLAIVDADPRFLGEVTAWPQMWDTSGTDVWTPIECSDILRRLGQGAQPLQSPLRAALVKEPALRAYWPLEDGSGASSGASALPGGSPLAVATGPGGSVQFAADSSFVASAPIAQFNSGRLSAPIATYTSTGAIQVRALLHVPSGGTVDGSSIFRLYNTGNAAIWTLTYGTGGSLTLTGRQINSDGSDSPISGGAFSPVAFGVDGATLYISMELTNSGSNVVTKVSTLAPGANAALVSNNTLTGWQIGRASKLTLNNGLSMDDVGIGHVSVESAITDLWAVGAAPLVGYAGETAQNRMARLSAAGGVAFQAGGFNAGATRMGPQGIDTYLNLMQEAATVDGGILYTPKDWLALAYRPSGGLFAQPPDVTLDYAAHQMSTLQPTEDDQSLRNDVTITRPGGSSVRVVDTTSKLSVNVPPAGVGTYDESLSLNVFSDSQLNDQAGWRVRVGTIDEARYPVINLNLASPSIATDDSLVEEISALDIGSRLVVVNPPAWIPPDPISQVVQGYTEQLAQYTRTLSLNCTPSVPYDTAGVWGPSYQGARYTSNGSSLQSSATSSALSISVATVSGPLWSHADGDFDIRVGGEQMRVTNVTGTSSPQTFTVTRSVNGVVKSQASGQTVELYTPSYYVL